MTSRKLNFDEENKQFIALYTNIQEEEIEKIFTKQPADKTFKEIVKFWKDVDQLSIRERMTQRAEYMEGKEGGAANNRQKTRQKSNTSRATTQPCPFALFYSIIFLYINAQTGSNHLNKNLIKLNGYSVRWLSCGSSALFHSDPLRGINKTWCAKFIKPFCAIK